MKVKKCNTCNKELPYDLIGHTIFSYEYFSVQFHPQLHKHELNLSDEDNNFCSEKCIGEFYKTEGNNSWRSIAKALAKEHRKAGVKW